MKTGEEPGKLKYMAHSPAVQARKNVRADLKFS